MYAFQSRDQRAQSGVGTAARGEHHRRKAGDWNFNVVPNPRLALRQIVDRSSRVDVCARRDQGSRVSAAGAWADVPYDRNFVTFRVTSNELRDSPYQKDGLLAGLMVPAKTPKGIIESVHKAAVSVLSNPDVSKRLNDLGFLVVGNRPEELEAYIKSEIDKYAKLIRQIGLPP